MDGMNASGNQELVTEIFSVVVLYEDRETRDHVLNVSRHMALTIGEEIQLKFSWWRFDFLQDADLAEQAANAASHADMLLVSAHPGRGLPLAFTQWVETWLPRRFNQESLLVALIGSEKDSGEDAATEYLRGIAARAGMDYLSKAASSNSEAIKDSERGFGKRRETKTPPLLENIVKQSPPPSHWGINE